MSELNLMNPGNIAPTRVKKRDFEPHYEGGCSPGKTAKSDKPTAVRATPRPGLPVLLAVLLTLAVSVLSACESSKEPSDGHSLADHMAACHALCLPAPVATYSEGHCECWSRSFTDGGVR